MTKVMISGSRSISKLPPEAQASLNRIMQLGFEIIIGDAPGVDSLAQKYLQSKGYKHVKVYYALFDGNGRPRNAIGYPCIGVRGSYRSRDKFMCSIADYALAVWDCKSIGTAENISRVRKTRVIYIKQEPMHKYSIMLDGMEVFDDGEGWCVYKCELPLCKDGTPIQIGQRYHTTDGEVLVVDKKLKQYGNKFCWLYDVEDDEHDSWEFLQYQFKKPVELEHPKL